MGAPGRLKLTSAPSVEPLSLSDAKTHCRVDTTDDDTYITALITVARKYVERRTKRALITQTWEYVMDDFPAHFDVPLPPLQSVTSITYTDTNGDSQTLASSYYTVDTYSEPARIVEAVGKDWPSTYDDVNVVKVTFVAGYGDAASDVDVDLIHAIKMLVAHWYEFREPVTDVGSVNNIPYSVEALLSPHIVRYL